MIPKKKLIILADILTKLEVAQNFIKSDRVAFCYKSNRHTTTNDFINEKTGEVLYPLNKEIGSELVYLRTAIQDLYNFIKREA